MCSTPQVPATIVEAQEKFELAMRNASAIDIVNNFGAAFNAAQVIGLLREALTDEVMNAVFMPLMNTKVGFRTATANPIKTDDPSPATTFPPSATRL